VTAFPHEPAVAGITAAGFRADVGQHEAWNRP
jgi:hypothetical protein